MYWLEDVQNGQRFVIDASRTTRVGRAPDNDVVLGYDTISEHHAAIFLDAGVPTLIDLDSTNGTYVKGVRIKGKTRLPVGGCFRLGCVTFNLHENNHRNSPKSSHSAHPKLQFYAQKKSGWLAAFLNLVCPGVGYMYCGRKTLGIFVLVLSIFLYVVADTDMLENQWLSPSEAAGIYVTLLLVVFIDGFVAAHSYNKKLMCRILGLEGLEETDEGILI